LDKLVICANDSITATNLSDSANSYAWSFGNGAVSNKVHPAFTYDQSGEYIVTLKAYRVNGFGNVCVDSVSRKVSVESPYGKINYTSGTLCNDLAARFEADVNFTDSLIWNFGDGTILRTKERIVFHRYLFSGSFVPTVTLISKAGCTSILKGTDTIRVDKIKSGFVTQMIQDCGLTTVYFTDTTRSSSGIKISNWLTGDGVSLSGKTISKSFTVTSDYTIRLIAESVLGCYDTTFKTISVPVYSVPNVQISGQTEICSNEDLKLSANVQSGDAIQSYLWRFSNGATFSEKDIQTKLNPGNYSVELIVRTINGCADTTSSNITIKKAPDVSLSNDVTICKGANTLLQVSGGITYSWSPDTDISCTDCNIVMVNPNESRTYQVIGKNEIGCTDTASTFVTVIQPFKMKITGRDSICIGQSTQMLVTGGVTYSWSPANSISDPTSGNPVFNPSVTTVYRVIGFDGKNCFTDTAFVTIAVGGYPTVDLGPDQVLPTGTLYPLKSTITNGPISKWEWTPNRNLDCDDCAEPIATVKTNTSYIVKVTSAYG
ncbi:MAG TPA: PKD domain-containing protein, partial [Lacibacter sp.]|nr:PKD domain-containing protein [Lacibacter sp.]